MPRIVFALTVVLLLLQVVRPKGGPEVTTPTEVMLDSATGRATLDYRVYNRSLGLIHLWRPNQANSVAVERMLAGSWYVQDRLPACAWHGGLDGRQSCSGAVVVALPGRYRVRVGWARGLHSNLRQAYGPEFIVRPPPAPAATVAVPSHRAPT